jgi:hypothetical protein
VFFVDALELAVGELPKIERELLLPRRQIVDRCEVVDAFFGVPHA